MPKTVMGRDDLKNVALQFSKAIIHFISLDSDVFDAINKVFIRCYIYIIYYEMLYIYYQCLFRNNRMLLV